MGSGHDPTTWLARLVDRHPMRFMLVVAVVAGVIAIFAWKWAAAWFGAGTALVARSRGSDKRARSMLDEARDRQAVHDRVVRDLQADADEAVRDNEAPVVGGDVDELVDEANEAISRGSL